MLLALYAAIKLNSDEAKTMRRFRTRIFEISGNWFFRWDNIDVPTVCDVTPPLVSKEEAESQMHEFIETEREKNGITIFVDG